MIWYNTALIMQYNLGSTWSAAVLFLLHDPKHTAITRLCTKRTMEHYRSWTASKGSEAVMDHVDKEQRKRQQTSKEELGEAWRTTPEDQLNK